jgi:hypothetical protein
MTKSFACAVGLFAIVAVNGVASAQDAVEWKVSDGGNGHWYRVNRAPLRWSAARTAALALGGDLSSIETRSEVVWLDKTFGEVALEPGGPCHIGGKQDPGSASISAGWRWLTGDLVNLSNFDAFAFDDWPGGGSWGVEDGQQDFLHAGGRVLYVGDINDIPWPGASEPLGTSLIEWSADCNGDGIVDYGQIRRGELADFNGNNVPDCCEQGISCPSTANQLLNGSLEGYSSNCGGFTTIGAGSTAIPGWTVSGANTIDWAADASGNCCRAADGIAYVDLNGSPSQSMGSALRQTVTTVIGRQYRLTARVAVNNCCHTAGTLQTFRLGGGGVTKDFVLTTFADAPCNHWELVQLDWTATATSASVEVRSMVANSAGGIFIDDIRLVELPGVLQVPAQYATIQAAIDAATSGKTVEVSPGTYNEAIDLKGKAITVKAVGARASTIIDGTGKTTSVVRAVTGETAATVLQGFTIRNGPIGSPVNTYRLGGGMFIDHASPTIRDCAFVNNAAGYGGGIYGLYSDSLVENCTFSQNTASTDGGGVQFFAGSPVVRSCAISDNLCTNRGGGLHLVQQVDGGFPTVDGCTITGNRASVSEGGGVSLARVDSAPRKPLVANCTIQGNTSYGRGGGLFALVSASMPQPNVTLTNNTICNNTSTISKRENVWALYEDGGNAICDCFSDIDGNRGVDNGDIAFTLLFIGELTDPDFIQPDQDMSGFVDTGDVALVLLNFGQCP